MFVWRKNRFEERITNMKIYAFLSMVFWLIRQFYMPNPFEVLGDGVTIVLYEVPILLTPYILNWLAGLVLPFFTFGVTGLYYISRSNPALGSVLYMGFFCVHVGILHLMSSIYPLYWLIVLIILAYVALHIMALILKSRLSFA